MLIVDAQIHLWTGGEVPARHRQTPHAHQIMPPVPPRAAIDQMLTRDGHQAECVIEFSIGQ
ncbi:MAG: hypothetical protein QOJ42_8199 [Acidobacteriaceae bacterium]|jgi:hypothetical protein|nr:hypothetical protein [Acidobacteriaceae bacterium]